MPFLTAAAFAVLAASEQTQATNLFWDNNGTSAVTSGTWDSTSAVWATSSTLTTATQAFGSGNFPEFSAGTTPTTLNITVNSAVSCAGMYARTSGSTVNISGTGSIGITSGLQGFLCTGNIVINVPLTGAGGVEQEEGAALSLYANNTYTGGTEITGGQNLYYNQNGSFSTGTITITGAYFGALINNASTNVTIANNFTSTSSVGVILAGGSAVGGLPGTTFTGNFSLPSGNTTLQTSAMSTTVDEISGVISGASANLIVADDGTLELAGANTYGGNTAITSPATLILMGNGTLGSGHYAGNITNGSALYLNSAANQTLSGVISGAGALTKNGSGTLVLTNAQSTYTGPTSLQAGMMSLAGAASINSSSSISIGPGAALDVSLSSQNPWNLNQPLNASGTGIGFAGFYPPPVTTAAVLVGAVSGSINLGAQPINLTIAPTNFTGDADQPALFVSQGTLQLNGNTLTVSNNGAAPLGYGTYTLIQQGSGNISAAQAPTLAGGTVYGNGIVPSGTASLVVSGGEVVLVVAPNGTTNPNDPFFSVLSPSPLATFVYGSANSVVLSGTVSNLSGGIAVSGDSITVQIGNASPQTAVIGANGSYSLTYSLPNYLAAGYYTISNYYTGSLGAVSDNSTALEITPTLLAVSATANNKTYTGNTAATATLQYAPLNGDAVTVVGAAGSTTNFATPNPGSGITVTITGLALTGANAGNYYLSSTAVTTTASILTPNMTWNGNDSANNSNWNDATNWAGGAAPNLSGDNLDFGGTVGLMPVMQNPYTNYSVTFDSTAGAFVITNAGVAATMTLGPGGLSDSSLAPEVISVPVANFVAVSSPWFVTNGGSLTISSNVSDVGGGLTLSGSGTLTLMGSNNPITGPITNLGGTLQIGGTAKLNNATYAGVINNSGALVYNSTSNQTLSGIISGSGTVNLTSGATLTLSGANTYTGATLANVGEISINTDNNLGAAPGAVVANQLTLENAGNLRINTNITLSANRGIYLAGGIGAIQVAQNDTLTYAGVISGPGTFYSGVSTTVGYGTVLLSGANTYTGGTTIACGTLKLGASGALPYGTSLLIASANSVSGNLNMNGASQTIGPLASSPGIGGTGTGVPGLTLSGALTVLQTNVNTTFAGVISGSGGSLILTVPVSGSPSRLTLTGTNTYTGPTTIDAGSLQLSGKGAISNTSSLNLAAGGTFDVSALTATTFNLSASTSLQAAGVGTGASAATIVGAAGGTVNLGSRPISLTYSPAGYTGDLTSPALFVSQGTLALNGNAFTVYNNGIAPLGAGTYTLVQQGSGNITSAGTYSVSVTGNGLAAAATASLQVTNGSVNLVVVTHVPTINSISRSGTNLVISGAGGPVSGQFYLISSTNLMLPPSQWQTVATNSFDGTGAFNLTIPIGTLPQDYFMIKVP